MINCLFLQTKPDSFKSLSYWATEWVSICNCMCVLCLHTYEEEYSSESIFSKCSQNSLWTALEAILCAPDSDSVYFVSFWNLSVLGKRNLGFEIIFSILTCIERMEAVISCCFPSGCCFLFLKLAAQKYFVSFTQLHNICTIKIAKITRLDYLWKLKTLQTLQKAQLSGTKAKVVEFVEIKATIFQSINVETDFNMQASNWRYSSPGAGLKSQQKHEWWFRTKFCLSC